MGQARPLANSLVRRQFARLAIAAPLSVSVGSLFTDGKTGMPMPPTPFPGGAQTAQVTLDGSGNGKVSLGPSLVRQHWQVNGVGVNCSTNVNEAQCSVFVGVPGGLFAQFYGQTFTGSTGDTCGMGDLDIQPGQVITAVWQGGDPGATGFMNIFGTYSYGQQ
jgi:hypothetical protein